MDAVTVCRANGIECNKLTDLGAYLEVCHDDCHLSGGDGEHDKHHEEEAKEVVELILPDRLHTQYMSGSSCATSCCDWGNMTCNPDVLGKYDIISCYVYVDWPTLSCIVQ